MRPAVLLAVPSGDLVLLRPGDTIGRHWTCALHLADQRVSEAHAWLTLRGGELRLLNLRGAIAIGGKLVDDPLLEPGLVFELAPGLALEVKEVVLPQRGLALTPAGQPSGPLQGTTSLLPGPELVRGYRSDALGWAFDDGEAWFFQPRSGEVIGPLQPGDVVQSEAGELRVSWHELQSGPATLKAWSRDQPLRIEAYHDSVRIFRRGVLAVAIRGVAARIISELAEVLQPMPWQVVAREVWTDSTDKWVLRRRWDTALMRLRKTLHEAGIRPDLISSDGAGSVALVPYPADEVLTDHT